MPFPKGNISRVAALFFPMEKIMGALPEGLPVMRENVEFPIWPGSPPPLFLAFSTSASP
jgi:hypothetical protein